MVRCPGDQKVARAAKAVVDASVIIKWYNLEPDAEKALELRAAYAARDIELLAPYLIIYEIANALRYNPDFGVEDVKSAVTDLMDMQLSLQQLDERQIQKATDLAFNYGITIYDSTYLALSETSELTLYTADDRLIEKTAHPRIRHIRDFKTI